MLPVLLVVCARAASAEPLRLELSSAGLKTYYVETLSSALGVIAQWRFDAVLICSEPIGTGVPDLVRRLRQESRVPIVAIFDGTDEELALETVEAGASQILPGGAPRLIAAQLHRLIELSQPRQFDSAGRFTVGPLRLDPGRGVATVDGEDVNLTACEFELLLLLAADLGELVHRDTIGKTIRSDTRRRRGVDMHICRIRRKLKDTAGDRLEVVTVYGQGYLLQLLRHPVAPAEARALALAA